MIKGIDGAVALQKSDQYTTGG